MDNTAAIRVGRLIEVRVVRGYDTRADVDELCAQIVAEVGKRPPTTVFVTVADWRSCPLMSEEAGDYLVRWMIKGNPRVQRSAALFSGVAPSAMSQFLRLVRRSRHPERRAFVDDGELRSWLGERLSEEERARLADFLREGERALSRPWSSAP